MKTSQATIRFASVLLFVMLAMNFLAAQSLRPGTDGDTRPSGHVQGAAQETLPAAKPTGGAVVQGNGINYHTGGVVLKANPVPIYVIWYGNWTNGAKPSDSQATVTLIETFLGSNALGGSSYEAINTTYGDTTGNVSGHLNFSGHSFDNYSAGTKFGDRSLPGIVSRAINGGLPNDPNGVYVVLTSSDVSETSGFCRTYCGFHTHGTINGSDIKYAYIGNVDKCPTGCEIQSTGPNSPATGVGGADGIANTLTHETEEAITDPDLNAWFDSSGNEDADKCNFKFGPTKLAANGAKFNQTFGGLNWMIQMEWENSRGGGCDQTLGGPFFTN
jgi:hypothetical protein